MNGHSSNYQHHLDCDPGRFDSEELVRRYQAGEQLYFQERKDAERIIRIRAEQAEKRSVLVEVALPVALELVAVCIFIACGAVWTFHFTKGI
jgi:hypothetical protein